ncbi:MAG: DUF721 domain-containing protein [Bdellovibrionales bacterium]|nr:DUF721 domain-containing protein [Bdellovibrionales bacterium]
MSSKKGERPNSHLTDLSSVLQSLLSNGKSPLSDQFLKFKLVKSWKKIVGETAAGSTLPVSLKFSRLVIWVNSSARLQELRFMEEELIRRINKFLGQDRITELRFTMDRSRATSASEVSNL